MSNPIHASANRPKMGSPPSKEMTNEALIKFLIQKKQFTEIMTDGIMKQISKMTERFHNNMKKIRKV